MDSEATGPPDRFAIIGIGLAAILVLAAGADGLQSWTSDSTLKTHSLAPPMHFEKGDNADDKRWFKSFSLSTNKTSFTAEVKPRAGGTVYISDVVRTVNADDEQRSIVLTGSEVTNSKIEAFEWHVRDGSSRVAALDHTTADPSASYTLPADGAYRLDLKIDLEQGAGRHNAGISFTVQLEVT